MTKQINWISLAIKIIDKQDTGKSDGVKTVRYIQSHIDTLLDKGKLTEKQSENLIRNIDIHLGIALPSQIVTICSKTARRWKAKGIATPTAAPVQALTLEDHWQALVAHYGDLQALASELCDRIESVKASDATQTVPSLQEAAEKPLNRNQQVTVSIWDGSGSGNLDYKDGSKEHVVFYEPSVVKKKLEAAGAPDSLWRSLEIAWGNLDQCDYQLGIIHGEKDPKGKKATTNPDCIVIKATPHADPSKRYVKFVQSAYPMTMLSGMDGWKKTKSGQPDIKGWIDGLAA